MYIYNQAKLAAETRQSQMLKEAERKRLVVIAQGGKRPFDILSWLLLILRRRPVTIQSKSTHSRKVSRRPASNQGW